jgi:hypothetical protein
MTNLKRIGRSLLAVLASGAALLWSGALPRVDGGFTSQAEARVGRPLTPMSYAGVARRTTRRAVAAGAAGAAAAGVYYNYPYPAPSCVQVVNSYGQVVYRCP